MSHRHGPHLPPRENQALGDCDAKGDCHGVRSEYVFGTGFCAMGNLDRQARSRNRHAPRCPFRPAMAVLTSLPSTRLKARYLLISTNAFYFGVSMLDCELF